MRPTIATVGGGIVTFFRVIRGFVGTVRLFLNRKGSSRPNARIGNGTFEVCAGAITRAADGLDTALARLLFFVFEEVGGG